MTEHPDQMLLPSSVAVAVEPQTLLANHVLLNTHSPRHARSSVEQVFFPHSLRTSRQRDVNFLHRSVRLSSVSFNLIRYGADVEVSTDAINRSHYVLVMPLSGRAEVTNHNQTSTLRPDCFVMLDPMAKFHFDMLADHSHLAIGIPKDRLSTHANRLLPGHAMGRLAFRHESYRLDESQKSLLDLIRYICKELDSSATMMNRLPVSLAMEDALLTMLVSSLLDGNIEMENGPDLCPPAYLLRAENFIMANLTEEITFEDILAAADVPERTLYNAFNKRFGISPMAWLRRQRLQQARLDLIQSRPDGPTITEVAHCYQMPHVGRFARAYNELFGELPSDTLKRGQSR